MRYVLFVLLLLLPGCRKSEATRIAETTGATHVWSARPQDTGQVHVFRIETKDGVFYLACGYNSVSLVKAK